MDILLTGGHSTKIVPLIAHTSMIIFKGNQFIFPINSFIFNLFQLKNISQKNTKHRKPNFGNAKLQKVGAFTYFFYY